MGGGQVSDPSFDRYVPERFRYTGGDGEYWFLGQDQVPSLNVSGGECAFAVLKGCGGTNGEERRVILEMKICKIAVYVTGGVRRYLGWRRAFGVCDRLQLLSSEGHIPSVVGERLNV
jgi:hypothetical protein